VTPIEQFTKHKFTQRLCDLKLIFKVIQGQNEKMNLVQGALAVIGSMHILLNNSSDNFCDRAVSL